MNANEKTYDLAVLIGRFQPFHFGHLSLLKQAIPLTKKLLILIGSSNVAPDTRNPFTFEERKAMISRALADSATGIEWTGINVDIQPLPDSPYNPTEWIEHVQYAVKQAATAVKPKVCLIGHERDETSAYLRWFPQFGYEGFTDQGGINATSIRKRLFTGSEIMDEGLDKVCPPTTVAFLQKFYGGDAWKRLQEEACAEDLYRLDWGPGPFVTADAVVIQQGHVLLIRRGKLPGKGALALPGGFLEVARNETMKEAALRELVEETSIFHGHGNLSFDQKTALVRPHFKASQVFDDPNRSRRGRIITHAHLFVLPDAYALPLVKGSDDAAEAMWVPLSEVSPVDMFEDHGHLLKAMMKYV